LPPGKPSRHHRDGRIEHIYCCSSSLPFFLAPCYMSQKPKTSRGPYDPVFDHQNPNPIIDRAASTRQATRMETASFTSGPSGPASNSGSPPRRGSSGCPKVSKTNNSMPTKTLVAARSLVLAPLAARVGLQTPTAASAAKGAAAPASKHAPFGGANPCMPSHMTEGGRRGPLPRHDIILGADQIHPECTTPVAAPGMELPLPAGETTALPRMSTSPPPAPLPESAQHSSTEPSEESDLSPFRAGNKTELGGIEDNTSITAALRASVQSETRIFSGLARTVEVFREPLMTLVACYHEAGTGLHSEHSRNCSYCWGAIGDASPN
jgi:hypothetical protein